MATAKKVSTRLASKHSIFGYPQQLSSSQLPSKEDVFKCYLWYRNAEDAKGNKNMKTRDVIKLVADDVIDIWTKASIPVIMYESVLTSLDKVISKGKELQKFVHGENSDIFVSEKTAFNELFDICTCKCVNKGILQRELCKCAVKIPIIEWNFWCDQKSAKKMSIGAVDKGVTAKLQKRKEREEKSKLYKVKMLKTHTCSNVEEEVLSSASSSHGSSDSEEQYSQESENSDTDSDDSIRSAQNRYQYPNLSSVMERTGLSNRDVCKVVNACLQDMGLDKSENLLEASKIRRQRIYWRQKEVDKHSQALQRLLCIGFDGRIDDTRLLEAERVPRTKREDHYVVVAFPQEQYVDHVAPQSGKSNDIQREIMSVINDTQSTGTICAVVCDSTNVNTGEHNGVIRQLEVGLNRPLQWLICMLHLNELPLRHVFSSIDGKTSGPTGFKGPIGSLLNFDPCSSPIVPFEAITGSVRDIDDQIKKDLSQDQIYLLRACLAVQCGQQTADSKDLQILQSASPGKLHHARWLTLANRLLRLYMSTDNPSPELQKLVAFVVNVYAPTWFQVKTHPRAFDGATNFFFLVRACRELNDSKLREITEKVLKTNCYFGHAENILIAALVDCDIAVRRDAAQKIVQARRDRNTDDTVRKFSKANIKLNFAAETYYDLIDWTSCKVTSPPMISELSDASLIDAVEHGPVQMTILPCHSQAVERAIRDVSRVSMKVYGHQARHGMLVSSEASRKKRPNLDTKYSFS